MLLRIKLVNKVMEVILIFTVLAELAIVSVHCDDRSQESSTSGDTNAAQQPLVECKDTAISLKSNNMSHCDNRVNRHGKWNMHCGLKCLSPEIQDVVCNKCIQSQCCYFNADPLYHMTRDRITPGQEDIFLATPEYPERKCGSSSSGGWSSIKIPVPFPHENMSATIDFLDINLPNTTHVRYCARSGSHTLKIGPKIDEPGCDHKNTGNYLTFWGTQITSLSIDVSLPSADTCRNRGVLMLVTVRESINPKFIPVSTAGPLGGSGGQDTSTPHIIQPGQTNKAYIAVISVLVVVLTSLVVITVLLRENVRNMFINLMKDKSQDDDITYVSTQNSRRGHANNIRISERILTQLNIMNNGEIEGTAQRIPQDEGTTGYDNEAVKYETLAPSGGSIDESQNRGLTPGTADHETSQENRRIEHYEKQKPKIVIQGSNNDRDAKCILRKETNQKPTRGQNDNSGEITLSDYDLCQSRTSLRKSNLDLFPEVIPQQPRDSFVMIHLSGQQHGQQHGQQEGGVYTINTDNYHRFSANLGNRMESSWDELHVPYGTDED